MAREVDYYEYVNLWDKGVIELVKKHGHSGVVSWIVEWGCFDILLNRKEGVVGCIFRECKTKLLEAKYGERS